MQVRKLICLRIRWLLRAASFFQGIISLIVIPSTLFQSVSLVQDYYPAKMSKWATAEQEIWLKAYFIEKYKPCMPSKNYTAFWPQYFKAWADKWPERTLCTELKDKPVDEALTKAENAILAAALEKRQEQLINKMRWLAGKGTRSRTLLSGKNAGLIGPLASLSKGTRAPQAREIFTKLEVDGKNEYGETIRSRLEVRIEEEGLKGNRAAIMKTRQEITKQVYDEAGDDVKALVASKKAELTHDAHERKKAIKLSKAARSSEDIQKSIDVMPTALGKILMDLHELTGWSYTVLAGGPDPSNEGRLRSLTVHVGNNEAGKDFGSALVGFKEKIVKPFDMFLRTTYPTDINRGTTMNNVKSDTNSPNDWDINMNHAGADGGAIWSDTSNGAQSFVMPASSGAQSLVMPSANTALLPASNGAPNHAQVSAPLVTTASSFGGNTFALATVPYRLPAGTSSELSLEFDQELNNTPMLSVSGYYDPQPEAPFSFNELGEILDNDWSSSGPSTSSRSSFSSQSPTAAMMELAPSNEVITAGLSEYSPTPSTSLDIPMFAPTAPAAPSLLPVFPPSTRTAPTTPSVPPVIPTFAQVAPAVSSVSSSMLPSFPPFGPPRLSHLMHSHTGNNAGSNIPSNHANNNTETLPTQATSTPPRLRHLQTSSNMARNEASVPGISQPDAEAVNKDLNELREESSPEQPTGRGKRTRKISKPREPETDKALPENHADPRAESQPEQNGRPKRIRTMSKRQEQDNAIGVATTKKAGAATKKGGKAKRSK
ncbi:hypothetical protein BJ138DRAFT_1114870 [Hygrophoropsis aurantiaca]|uniref:Uncharacterized protein n=1 Tax=Hygrophoropsis aurantiaca TaxID=72124 RepID=A0ACB8A7S7_9AGAM|nr:hypothetical protein BJ138DRAFT_1114870 [Hygrophoropsis aurantiaca]